MSVAATSRTTRTGSIAEIADATMDATGLPNLFELALGYVHERPGAPPDDPYFQSDPVGRYGWLWQTTFGRRLRVLHVGRDPSCIVPWLPVLVEHADQMALEQVVFTWGAAFALERSDAGWTRLSGGFPTDPPRHLAATLDRAIRRADPQRPSEGSSAASVNCSPSTDDPFKACPEIAARRGQWL